MFKFSHVMGKVGYSVCGQVWFLLLFFFHPYLQRQNNFLDFMFASLYDVARAPDKAGFLRLILGKFSYFQQKK